MYQYPQYHNFDLDPRISVSGFHDAVAEGEEALLRALRRQMAEGGKRICMELYPGVDEAKILGMLSQLDDTTILRSEDARLSQEALREQFAEAITDDRVFGIMSCALLRDCFDPVELRELSAKVDAAEGPVIVVGVGASLAMPEPDCLWYWDVTRWEIQLRYRRGAGTWMAGALDGQQLTKYKVGFFIEWRMADRQKRALMERVDCWVDANSPDNPRMIGRDAYQAALDQAAAKPFRMQAYYDPSVWGGQWMKRVFGLDPSVSNYGWSFDGVPEENCLKFDFGDGYAVFPAMNLVLSRSQQLLGEHVYGRFGAEFPIRFDYLDTMEGGNLSLQVHPLTQYIQQKFGMHYTQDESYYILDATEDSCVYLGVKPGIAPGEFRQALEQAQAGEEPLDVKKYVNCIPVAKHDHVLIPAGTVHCSGKDTVVLEISSTPYIFTFKLWDWGRIGLDGLPRPIHIEHGMANIQFDRDTDWVKRQLVHQERTLVSDSAGMVEHTGLHNLEFIETRRYTLRGERTVDCADSVTVVNLVEGPEGLIRSVDGSFKDIVVHYGETFIIPASVGQFKLSPAGKANIMFIAASVR